MSELADRERVEDLALATRAGPFVWGFGSQVASSATSFGLSLVAALLLGPTGLGTVFVGFSFYLLALGFQRALVTDPLIAASSTLDGVARANATRAALTMCILSSGFLALAGAAAGFMFRGEVSTGLSLFVPWLVPALLQDFWRVILFRDGRGRAAMTNDVVWALIMGAVVPLSLLFRSAWVVVSAWGLGAVAGMMLGFFQTSIRPDALIRSSKWWRRTAWPLGRWLAAEGVVYTLGSHGLVFVLVFILGTRSLGGIRAVQTLFAPLSILIPAIALPGLPELSRQMARSVQRARRLASLLGAASLALTGTYVLVGLFAGEQLLILVFGKEFAVFESLIWPVAIGQLFVASAVGFTLLLRAQARGKAVLFPRVVGSVSALGLATALATSYGAEGAAWGMAIGSTAAALLISILAFRGPGKQHERSD